MQQNLKKTIKAPNPVLYLPALLCFKTYFRLFHNAVFQTDDRLRAEKGRLIILGNHVSSFDPFVTGCAVFPRRVNFLTSEYYFRDPKFAFLFGLINAIPKVQFYRDIGAVRKVIRALKNECAVCIFPEGTRSRSGGAHYFVPAIAKLIKITGSPVAFTSIKGAYLGYPRWSQSGYRRGRIVIASELLLSAAQVREMSADEIFETVKKRMEYNEYEWQKEQRLRFRTKAPAAGLHNILYKCPRCGSEFENRSEQSELICGKCGNTGIIDEYGSMTAKTEADIVFPDPYVWDEWQKMKLREFAQNPDFSHTDKVELRVASPGKATARAGEGELTLYPDRIEYNGTHFGNKSHMIFLFRNITGISLTYGEMIEMYDPRTGSTLEFVIENGKHAVLYEHMFEVFIGFCAE